MKKNYIVSTAALLTVIIVAASCKEKTPTKVHAGHDQQLQVDTALKALTQPVNAQVIASIPVINPKKGPRTYTMELNGVMAYDTRNQTAIASRVAGRIERLLVKYNYQPVQKGQLIMEIYSPDLAAAQRELLFVAKQDDTEGLLSKAKQRLLLLGMQPAQIEQVLKTGQVIYRVPVYSNASGYILEQTAATASAPAAPAMAPAAAGDGMGGMGDQAAAAPALAAPTSTPVLLREGQYVAAGQPVFTIYQPNSLVAEFSLTPQMAARLKRGQSLTFYPPNDKENTTTATIGLIEPVFRNGQNFTLARIYLNKRSFRPGQLLTASLPVEYEGPFWLPAEAVTRLGNQYILFRKTNNVFTPIEIKITATIANMVQVGTDMTGWQIAANAAYLVDSESFIKTSNSPQQ
jgi:hypothetical protein